MGSSTEKIERLTLPVSAADLRDLSLLLIDAVESDAAVSFLAPLSLESAQAFWRKATTDPHPAAAFLVARDAEGIAGSALLQPAWAPNQPHRAEVVKVLVHRRCRQRGIATRLMQAIEESARKSGFSLLTLDAKAGGNAERLYRKLGWIHVGTIPGFAFDTDGKTLHDDVIFYKGLTTSR